MSRARIELLEKLEAHLQLVQEQPQTLLDSKLLEQCEVSVLVAEVPEAELTIWEALFYQIGATLPTLQQDPAPLLGVALKLSVPLSFDHVNKLQLLPGLDLDAVPFHLLTLNLLAKATSNAAHVELLAGKPDLIASIVKLWLCAEDAGTGSQAGSLLLDFLRISKNLPEPAGPNDSAPYYGQGPMWKRVFGDKDIFRLFFDCTLTADTANPFGLSNRRKTIAQARLMDWLPQVGLMDWDTLVRCHNAELGTEYGLELGSDLLTFVCQSMVDTDDILMHINLLNFYSTLVSTVRKRINAAGMSSASLQYLISQRVHRQVLLYWASPDPTKPLEASYLSGPSAQYIATYASVYPEHFEDSDLTEIHDKLITSLNISAGQWAQGQSPKHALHILSSVPRTFIFPADATSQSFKNSALALVPCKITNEDALNTLASIFHGPDSAAQEETPLHSQDVLLQPKTPKVRLGVECEAATALFWLYLSENSTLFVDLIAHAEVVVLKDRALAAIHLMYAVATANWAPGSSESTPEMANSNSSSGALGRRTRIYAVTAANPSLPKTGIEALLYPAIRNVIFPYLLKPPKKLSSLVGGHGDAESAAYSIATAKYDLVKVVYDKLIKLAAESQDAPERSALARALRERVVAGPWGANEDAGSRIATMDR